MAAASGSGFGFGKARTLVAKKATAVMRVAYFMVSWKVVSVAAVDGHNTATLHDTWVGDMDGNKRLGEGVACMCALMGRDC